MVPPGGVTQQCGLQQLWVRGLHILEFKCIWTKLFGREYEAGFLSLSKRFNIANIAFSFSSASETRLASFHFGHKSIKTKGQREDLRGEDS